MPLKTEYSCPPKVLQGPGYWNQDKNRETGATKIYHEGRRKADRRGLEHGRRGGWPRSHLSHVHTEGPTRVGTALGGRSYFCSLDAVVFGPSHSIKV